MVKENTVVKEQKWSVSEEEIRPFSNFDILDFLSIRNLLILVVVRVLRKSIGNWRKLEAFQTKKSLLFSLFFIYFYHLLPVIKISNLFFSLFQNHILRHVSVSLKQKIKLQGICFPSPSIHLRTLQHIPQLHVKRLHTKVPSMYVC